MSLQYKQHLRFLVACLLLLMGAACTAAPTTVVEEIPSQAAVEPTSVVLSLPTPTPQPIDPPTPAPTNTHDPSANDNPYYYGGLVMTIENVGETLAMKPKGSFLLLLGESHVWTVEISDPEVISLNFKITPEPGEQGVFIARKRGKATLLAVGEPVCRSENPPCSRPSLLFTLNIVVE